MGGMCARVCPTEVLCEEACVRNVHEDKPVDIGLLQRHATDPILEAGTQLFERAAPSGRRVAVVGGGPAALSCAHRLACLGHGVTVYCRDGKLGGLNEYGIAAYKTVDDFAQRETSTSSRSAASKSATESRLAASFHSTACGAGSMRFSWRSACLASIGWASSPKTWTE